MEVVEYPWDKVFPDTEQGAIDCLRVQMREDIEWKGATAIPDPEVYGVWKVINPNLPADDGRTNIVYMKGHKNPWGHVREENDFEEIG